MDSYPPPFQHSQPKNNTTKVVLIVLGIVFGLCALLSAVLGFFLCKGWKEAGPLVGCAITLEGVAKATREYARAHEGKLPNAATWQDDIKTYYVAWRGKNKDVGPFSSADPSGNMPCIATEDVHTGIAYNLDLSGKKIADLKDPEGTLMFFETDKTGHNLSEKYVEKSDDKAPKIFGEKRGWMKVGVTGDVKGGKANAKFDFGN